MNFVAKGWRRPKRKKGEKHMANNPNRVLGRTGARPLSQDEIEGVEGGSIRSVLSVLRTGTAANPDFTTDE
jgi:hypothetical protein